MTMTFIGTVTVGWVGLGSCFSTIMQLTSGRHACAFQLLNQLFVL